LSTLQPLHELEKWWKDPDPWQYENDPADRQRRAMLLSVIPDKPFEHVIDIGCGNGFVTTMLPGKHILGTDISSAAISHAEKRDKGGKDISFRMCSIFDIPSFNWTNKFDLVIVAGVLYPQYIGESHRLVYCIIDEILKKDGILISCHINEWYKSCFPYHIINREYYSYKEYTHFLETYMKI